MDPVDLEQLLYELLSVNAETVTIEPKSLTPGCVFSSKSPWNKHVVIKPPMPVSPCRVRVTVRHLHGGHNVSVLMTANARAEVYRYRLSATQLPRVPTVPRCHIPDDPEPGDRVIHHFHDAHQLGVGRFFEYNGDEWLQVKEGYDDRGRCRTDVCVYPLGINHIVNNTSKPDPYGWYSFLSAEHHPHLYVDGIPMPARAVSELAAGDVIRIPGGGRLQVTEVRARRSATTLVVRLLKRSIYPMPHFMWDRSEGAIAEHHDSGRTRSLYPVEPRPGELLGAVNLLPGDTVITAWGLPYSAVATIDDVWGQPLLNHMHVHGTTSDGRSVRIVTGHENRYYLLHRPASVHTRAMYEPLARAHA